MAKRHGRGPEKRTGEPKRSLRTLKIGDIQVTTIRPNRGVIMIAQRYVENGKSWPSPDVKAEAIQLLSEQFDSETTMMESQRDALRKSAEDLRNQITALSRKMQERRQSRDASIEAELESALK